MSSRFNWLHLTDLHFGLAGQEQLWPNIREAFFEDLRRLHDRTGPWDAVLFTGDFVQRGDRKEYERLDAEVLGPLWEQLRKLGSGEAVLLAVPGNHDLVRPIGPKDTRKPTAAEKFLLKPELFMEVADDFWSDPLSEYRQVVNVAFENFIEWLERCLIPQPRINTGLLPGDFAVTLETSDQKRRIGVLGLNTTFLQLAGGDYRNKLVWDVQQFHAPCGSNGPGWVSEHDVCLLLTHQGPEWLNERCRNEVYPEINKAGRFAVHLFGHEHENNGSTTIQNGGEALRRWQGPSLFSREPWGDPPTIERRHGYSAGCVEFENDSSATIRKWPRIGIDRKSNGWAFDRDTNACLCDDGGEQPEPIKLKPRQASSAAPVNASGLSRRQEQLLKAYRQAALKLVDIVDLANLPEDERQIAMQRFALRQLYIPLRLIVDAPTRAEIGNLDEQTLMAWEQQREQARLVAAGRVAKNENDGDTSSDQRQSLGELLADTPPSTGKKKRSRRKKSEPTPSPQAITKRLVVLGDPGGGKTTLLRWLATAWLLRAERPEDVAALPDVGSLPADERLPILVRCRQLERTGLSSCTLPDILLQTLRSMELKLPDSDLNVLVEAVVEQLEAGRAALLVDGLDEITDPQLRSRFCERLEIIAEQYTQTPLIATSRIVGYREMPRRLGRGFRHATLAGLTAEDKDDFVRRWCEAVERDPARRKDEADKLLTGIHDSTSRIERLTGNPMMLTTMALVQRKVGRLPTKRHKLYEEAVGLLLRWRSDVDEPLDIYEAWPQLEYVAWAMCDRGVQRLRRDEVLSLLADLRRDHPNLHAVAKRTPDEFLKRVESRTSLLVEVGAVRHDGLEVPVYEFRHLTFQEYLAAIALIRGHFPGHDPQKPLAARIAPLAGRMERVRKKFGRDEEQVTENWREALRLCVAACNDDDVDASLRAILGTDGRDDIPAVQTRPRSILAALCLADEPNASQAVMQAVFQRFAESVGEHDGGGNAMTGLDRAALEVATSAAAESLELALATEFIRRGPENRSHPGGLNGMVAVHRAASALGSAEDESASRIAWMQTQTERLRSIDDRIAIAAALAVMQAAFEKKASLVPSLSTSLLSLIPRSPAAGHAACWALWWLSDGDGRKPVWQPDAGERSQLLQFLPPHATALTDPKGLRYLSLVIGNIRLSDAVPSLVALLIHEDDDTRCAALKGLAEIRGDETDSCLLTEDIDGNYPWLDPSEAIGEDRVQNAAPLLNLPVAEIRRRYLALAADFGLTCDFTAEA